ncbi:MAG: DUF488 family protein [Gammaproteobacteria bacterium]|nr:DUF488 family protein [Gammaproteobacteria bacterium]
MGYKTDSDWLDVTEKGNAERIAKGSPGGHRGIGAAFAPSAPLRREYVRLYRANQDGSLTDAQWLAYRKKFLAEMRESYRRHRAAWDELLKLDRVVLLCFCTDHTRCHRRILAEDVLPKLGAHYVTELNWKTGDPA